MHSGRAGKGIPARISCLKRGDIACMFAIIQPNFVIYEHMNVMKIQPHGYCRRRTNLRFAAGPKGRARINSMQNIALYREIACHPSPS
jgi:hypothetical protein